MRKMRKWTFIILMTMLYLAGCVGDSPDKSTEVSVTTTENTSTEQNVEITEALSDNETMEAMEAEEESTTETVVEEELPIPYDFILE